MPELLVLDSVQRESLLVFARPCKELAQWLLQKCMQTFADESVLCARRAESFGVVECICYPACCYCTLSNWYHICSTHTCSFFLLNGCDICGWEMSGAEWYLPVAYLSEGQQDVKATLQSCTTATQCSKA